MRKIPLPPPHPYRRRKKLKSLPPSPLSPPPPPPHSSPSPPYPLPPPPPSSHPQPRPHASCASSRRRAFFKRGLCVYVSLPGWRRRTGSFRDGVVSVSYRRVRSDQFFSSLSQPFPFPPGKSFRSVPGFLVREVSWGGRTLRGRAGGGRGGDKQRAFQPPPPKKKKMDGEENLVCWETSLILAERAYISSGMDLRAGRRKEPGRKKKIYLDGRNQDSPPKNTSLLPRNKPPPNPPPPGPPQTPVPTGYKPPPPHRI